MRIAQGPSPVPTITWWVSAGRRINDGNLATSFWGISDHWPSPGESGARERRSTLFSMFRSGMAIAVALAATAALSGSAGSASPASRAACPTSTVHYTHYPGTAAGLGNLPWVGASPASEGLVGLLVYWREDWRAAHLATAQMYSGGQAPNGGLKMKILWAFLAPKAKRATDAQMLTVKARRLDGPGKTWQRFTAISYSGQNRAPSYASVINLPVPGCWRIEATAGSLHGTSTFRALSRSE
jgi:hypothetical protein